MNFAKDQLEEIVSLATVKMNLIRQQELYLTSSL